MALARTTRPWHMFSPLTMGGVVRMNVAAACGMWISKLTVVTTLLMVAVRMGTREGGAVSGTERGGSLIHTVKFTATTDRQRPRSYGGPVPYSCSSRSSGILPWLPSRTLPSTTSPSTSRTRTRSAWASGTTTQGSSSLLALSARAHGLDCQE